MPGFWFPAPCYDPGMGRKSGRRPGGPREQERPSLFFIIALAVGIVLLLWGAWVVISRPVTPKNVGRVVMARTIDAA